MSLSRDDAQTLATLIHDEYPGRFDAEVVRDNRHAYYINLYDYATATRHNIFDYESWPILARSLNEQLKAIKLCPICNTTNVSKHSCAGGIASYASFMREAIEHVEAKIKEKGICLICERVCDNPDAIRQWQQHTINCPIRK